MPTSHESLLRHRAAHANDDASRQVWFYHSHTYFDHTTPAAVEEARAFLDRIAQAFAASTHVEVHKIVPFPVGPHPRGSFEVLFTRVVMPDYVSWLMFHRPEGMSILIHPLTRSQRADHTSRGLWLGPQLELATDILDRSDAASGARSEESIIEGTKRH